ncbi:matrixin family metalloprotease [Cellulomonas cellasea]|uniref:Peptidase metallopeptidase domain-containing protein n=1 Tax=Cellulomonas cellasea TaxID=43670 RepID=A0A7W4UDI6_9CELL|nr:matrixin family metalloprotease [Cellulomonas cellasea]MBB2922213.1 hypothetical protein [Cellulomonas cellasea]
MADLDSSAMSARPERPRPDRRSGATAEQIAALLEQAAAAGADLLGIAATLQNLAGTLADTVGGHLDAVAAQEAAVRVLRIPQTNPGLAAEHATRLAEYVHTLAARRNDAGDRDGAIDSVREAGALYGAAAQVVGADAARIVQQLMVASKLCSALGVPDAALSATQLAVSLLSASASAPPTPEQLLELAELGQTLVARHLDVAQLGQADLAGQIASDQLAAAAQTVWTQVGENVWTLTELARDLMAGGLQLQAGAVVRAAQSAVEDPPTLLEPEAAAPLEPGLPDAAVPTVRAIAKRKDLLRRVVDSGSALGAVLTAGGLMVTAARPLSLLQAYTPTRFCATPDQPQIPGGVRPLTAGETEKRWPNPALRVSIDPKGIKPPETMLPVAVGIIRDQFLAWQAAVIGPGGPVFDFTFVAPGSGEDIDVSFRVERGDDVTFGKRGGTDGLAEPDPSGSIRLDPGEQWNDEYLGAVTLHEIGHMLGARHSSTPGSIMYPYTPKPGSLDAETIERVRDAYATYPQQPLQDRGTSSKPALSRTTFATFTSVTRTPHMVWKGAQDDKQIWHSQLANGSWSPQQPVPGAFSDRGPGLVEVGGVSETQLLLAWKGVEGDGRLYWTKRMPGGRWEAPRPPLSKRASSDGPSMCMTTEKLYMAWRGVGGDEGIYTSVWDGNETWSDQKGPLAARATTHTPTMALLGRRLYMFWKGAGSDHSAWWSMLDLNPTVPETTPLWTSQRQITFDRYEVSGATPIPIGTTTGPVATTRRNRILLAWKGATDRRIWLSTFDGTSFTGQLPLHDAGTTTGPGLVVVDGTAHLAWRGAEGDSTIWWKPI